MLIDEIIKVKVSMKNIEHFKKLNIECNLKDIIEIDPKNLNEGSHILVNVKCDICNFEKQLSFQKYIKNIKNGGIYCCSSKCAQSKVKNTSLEKFGSEYYVQTDEYKKRHKETSMKVYGVEHHTQNEDVKNRIKETSMKIYGVDNPSKSQIVIDKIKNTFLDRYGVENISSLDYIKNKISQNSITFFKNNYNLNILKYLNNQYYLICDRCSNEYNIHKKTLRNRLIGNTIPCTICNPIHNIFFSEKEKLLLNFIENNYKHTIITNTKSIISPYELDIYLPELKLAFEFNGVYWHNELNKDKNYHKMKTDLCEKNGIQLIHIYEDDWDYKQEIVKSMILNKLNLTENKIYARKTEIREITDNILIRDFLDKNHLQGFIGSKIKIGLFYENELVSLMTFGNLKKPINDNIINEYDMLRFCNKINTTVIGGASKLFQYFIKIYKPTQIISYVDRSHSNGNLYKQLGFVLSHITEPNYYYVIDGIRNNRFNFKKNILIKEGYNLDKTEHNIMLERKIYRIYNSGYIIFIYN